MQAPVSKDNAEHYTWGQHCDGWHLVKDPSLSIIQERMPPGTQEARHYHQNARQFFFVLKGKATLECDGTSHELIKGKGLVIPPGVPHQMFNMTTDELEFIVVSLPPSHGDRVPA